MEEKKVKLSSSADILLNYYWWVYKTTPERVTEDGIVVPITELLEHAGIDYYQQKTGRMKLIEVGFITTKFRDIPRKLFVKLDEEKVAEYLS